MAEKIVLPISRELLIKGMDLSMKKVQVTYKLGAKLKLNTYPKAGSRCDCSGYVRWIIYLASRGQVKMPDGSWYQQAWCRTKKLTKVPYSDCAKRDSILRIAFMAQEGDDVGHVWLVINGMTIECRGGVGASRRDWNTSTLLHNVDYCYEMTDELP